MLYVVVYKMATRPLYVVKWAGHYRTDYSSPMDEATLERSLAHVRTCYPDARIYRWD